MRLHRIYPRMSVGLFEFPQRVDVLRPQLSQIHRRSRRPKIWLRSRSPTSLSWTMSRSSIRNTALRSATNWKSAKSTRSTISKPAPDVLVRNEEVFTYWRRLGLEYMFLGLEAIDEEGLKAHRKRSSLRNQHQGARSRTQARYRRWRSTLSPIRAGTSGASRLSANGR